MSGNGIIVKTSEYVAWSSRYYQSIIQKCLAIHGHDPELVQFITGFADAGEAVVRCGVNHVTFIGSPAVGKLVQRNAVDSLVPCVLELGGKDCAILLKDADLKQAIPVLMRGVFQNCGQNCIGIERIIVADEIYDKVVNEMDARISKLRQGSVLADGDGVDCGAQTMGTQVLLYFVSLDRVWLLLISHVCSLRNWKAWFRRLCLAEHVCSRAASGFIIPSIQKLNTLNRHCWWMLHQTWKLLTRKYLHPSWLSCATRAPRMLCALRTHAPTVLAPLCFRLTSLLLRKCAFNSRLV